VALELTAGAARTERRQITRYGDPHDTGLDDLVEGAGSCDLRLDLIGGLSERRRRARRAANQQARQGAGRKLSSPRQEPIAMAHPVGREMNWGRERLRIHLILSPAHSAGTGCTPSWAASASTSTVPSSTLFARSRLISPSQAATTTVATQLPM